jgi:NAD(P)-dependent dehydrogenase (short-subunit alcohol dehydrogenase family)
MILATVAWALGEALMRRSPASDRWARSIWTVGVALAVMHVVLAFHFVYAWSHEAAVAATARQAADRFGWGWRGGIYVNYAFLALWLADVCWWWLAPVSHVSRRQWSETARVILFAFMFLNGAVVFASGHGRLVGIASLAMVLLASPARRRSAVAP